MRIIGKALQHRLFTVILLVAFIAVLLFLMGCSGQQHTPQIPVPPALPD